MRLRSLTNNPIRRGGRAVQSLKAIETTRYFAQRVPPRREAERLLLSVTMQRGKTETQSTAGNKMIVHESGYTQKGIESSNDAPPRKKEKLRLIEDSTSDP
mmetsp:Transcript_10599/g.39494  ORF Transcript_10599/g.39494 Transcript_10599/m.39494 type:complete len:101 (+) Transcript_10599:1147-1449(+)